MKNPTIISYYPQTIDSALIAFQNQFPDCNLVIIHNNNQIVVANQLINPNLKQSSLKQSNQATIFTYHFDVHHLSVIIDFCKQVQKPIPYLICQLQRADLQNRILIDDWIKQLNNLHYQSQMIKINASHFGSVQNHTTCFLISYFQSSTTLYDIDLKVLNQIKNPATNFLPIIDVLDQTNQWKQFSGYPILNQNNNGVNKLLVYNNLEQQLCTTIYGASGKLPSLKSHPVAKLKIKYTNSASQTICRPLNCLEVVRAFDYLDQVYNKLKKRFNDQTIIKLITKSTPLRVFQTIIETLKIDHY